MASTQVMALEALTLRSDLHGLTLTNLDTLESAVVAYKSRFDIEEMFRDFKSGGYNLENTNVSGERLIILILLIAIAYTSATIQGQQIKRLGIQKYVGRVKEYGRTERRHSSFYIGLYSQTWVNFIDNSWELVRGLLRLILISASIINEGREL